VLWVLVAWCSYVYWVVSSSNSGQDIIIMDRKSLESVVSINVSMSNIWVTRCRRLPLRKNLLIRFLSAVEMCPAKAGRA